METFTFTADELTTFLEAVIDDARERFGLAVQQHRPYEPFTDEIRKGYYLQARNSAIALALKGEKA